MGSHCVALDVVLGALAEQGFSARTLAVGSMGGVAAARRGECDLAPVHLLDPAGGTYNAHLLRPVLRLVPGWQRMQGFVFRPGDERFAGRSAQDALKAALADPALPDGQPQCRRRHPHPDRPLLAGARPPGYANQPNSHNAVAAAVAQGRADWGIAIEPVAKLYGLGFLPVAPEHYDFLLVESRARRPARAGLPRRALLRRCRRARTPSRALGMQPVGGLCRDGISL